MFFNYYLNKFKYAWRGLVYVARRENSFRLQLILMLVVVILAWYFKITAFAWALLIIVIGLVLALEIFNTVLERLLDLVEPRLSLHVAFLKDLLAAAVLLASLAAVVVGFIIFIF